MPEGKPAKLMFDAHDELTERHALVFQSEAIPHLQFNARFYTGTRLDHMRRYSELSDAVTEAREWCNKTH